MSKTIKWYKNIFLYTIDIKFYNSLVIWITLNPGNYRLPALQTENRPHDQGAPYETPFIFWGKESTTPSTLRLNERHFCHTHPTNRVADK
jgi:hypothetical protein